MKTHKLLLITLIQFLLCVYYSYGQLRINEIDVQTDPITITPGGIFISEIANPKDHPSARFIELTNNSSSNVSLGGWSIRFYLDGSLIPTNYSVSGIVMPGNKFIIAANNDTFNKYYGFNPNVNFSNPLWFNGNDVVELFNGSIVVDVYGIKGQDGTGKLWEYKDSRSVRKPFVFSGKTTFDQTQWTFSYPFPRFITDFDPGVHTMNSNSNDISQFIELYDGGAGNTNLNNYSLVLYDGEADTVYAVFKLDGKFTSVTGYFVAGNSTVSAATMASGIVIPDDIIQNGSDAIALYYNSSIKKGDTKTNANLVDIIVYDTDDADDVGLISLLNLGQPQVNENMTKMAQFHSLQRIPNGAGGLKNTSYYYPVTTTPGFQNMSSAIPNLKLIHEIQGRFMITPLSLGDTVVVKAIVVGDFQTSNIKGFFVQEENFDIDTSNKTSEGIFIYDNALGVDVNVGDLVEVKGIVDEYNGLTQIKNLKYVKKISNYNALPAAVNLNLPLDSANHLECYEGMYVKMSQDLIVTNVQDLGKFGEFWASANDRLWEPTNIVKWGLPAKTYSDSYIYNRILIDDGQIIENPDPIKYPSPDLSANNTLRVGTKFNNLEGCLTNSSSGLTGISKYRIHPIKPIGFNNSNNPRKNNISVSGNVKVASMNIQNYFTTLNLQGAQSALELKRQRAKIIHALRLINADIIGLTEIENNDSASLVDLVKSLNDSIGIPKSYTFIKTNKLGAKETKVAILYKADSVTPIGAWKILTSPNFPIPPLAQTFKDIKSNQEFTIVINQYIQRKCVGGETGGNQNTNDGQLCNNQIRKTASTEEITWLNSNPTGSTKSNRIMVLGDFNAFLNEEAIEHYRINKYKVLADSFGGSSNYSINFDGNSGLVDHAIVRDSMWKFISDFKVWHINADEPNILGYDTNNLSSYQIDSLFGINPFRSSNHDPIVVGLNFGSALPLKIIDTILSHVTCFGGVNGKIHIEINGSSSPYTFSWSNLSNTKDLINLASGTYTVTIKDKMSATIIGTFTLSQPSVINILPTYNHIKCRSELTGSINLLVNGGLPGYSYSWMTGENTPIIINKPAGSYNLSVTDSKGCTKTANYTITQPPLDFKITTSALINVKCYGFSSGGVNITALYGTTPYTYSWSNGQIVEDLASLPAGNYNVTVTDVNSCKAIENYTITQPAQDLTVSNSPLTNVSCYGNSDGMIDITVVGGTSGYKYSWSNLKYTQDISTLIAGNYTVTIKDTNDCVLTASYSITQPQLLKIDSTIVSPVKCFGHLDGELNVYASGGTLPYLYSWSNSNTTKNINSLSFGNYTVTITDKNLCSIVKSAVITQPTLLVVNNNPLTHVKCRGDNDGKINIIVGGGTLPYIYQWSNGSVNIDPGSLYGDITYTVTVIDKNNCSTTGMYTITQPSFGVDITGVKTDVSVYLGNNGAVDISVSGGLGPYSYSWSNGSTSEDLTSLIAGDYFVTATDMNGCKDIDTFKIKQPLPLSVSLSMWPVKCKGQANGIVRALVIGGKTPYSYSWSVAGTNDSIVNLVTGNYTVTVTDFVGAKDTTSIFVTEPLDISILNDSIKAVRCHSGNSGRIALLVSGGNGLYTYTWSNGKNKRHIDTLIAGNYSVTIYDKFNCQLTASFIITQPPALKDSIVITNVSCPGDVNGKLDLKVKGGVGPYLFSWSIGATTEDLITISDGSYSITVTDAQACLMNRNYIVGTTAIKPIVNLGVDTIICETDSVLLVGGPNTNTYSWNTGSNSDQILVKTQGTYTVTVSNGTCTNSDEFNLTVNKKAIVNAGIDISACSNIPAINLSGSISGGSSTGVWSSSGDGSFSSVSSLITAYYLGTADKTSSSITIDLSSTNNGACPIVSDQLTISIVSAPTVIAGVDTVVCSGINIIPLSGIVSGSSIRGKWSTTGSGAFVPSDTVLNASYQPTSSDKSVGNISLILTANFVNCPVVSSTKKLTIENIKAGFNFNGLCSNLSTNFVNTSTINTGTLSSWKWDFGNATNSNLSNSSTVYTTAGNYTVKYVVGTTNCFDSISKVVAISSKPNVGFSYVSECDNVTFTDTSKINNGSLASWDWVLSNGQKLSGANPVYDVKTNGTVTDVTLTVTSSAGCSDKLNRMLVLKKIPIAEFSTNPLKEFKTNAEIKFINTSKDAVSYSWDFGDKKGTSTEKEPVYSYSSFGINKVILDVVSKDGCKDSASRIIPIIVPYAIANAFSPNGDNVNDVIHLLGGPFKEINLKIYNKWGTMVFETKNQEVGWDGNLNGMKQPQGVYVYILKLITFEDKVIEKSGNITLLR